MEQGLFAGQHESSDSRGYSRAFTDCGILNQSLTNALAQCAAWTTVALVKTSLLNTTQFHTLWSQMLLSSGGKARQLVEYHNKYVLWFHCSFVTQLTTVTWRYGPKSGLDAQLLCPYYPSYRIYQHYRVIINNYSRPRSHPPQLL